jgi:pimeloyl-ACP methyl ester carboxylesterase
MHRVMRSGLLLLALVAFSTQAQAGACKGELRSFDIYENGVKLGQGQVRDFIPNTQMLRERGRGLVLPTTNGENAVDRLWARELCKEGLQTQLLVSWPETGYDFLDPRMHNDFVRRVRAAVNSLLGDDPSPLALVGTSLGGIAASSLIAREPRIKVAALIVTGAYVSEIIALSDHKTAREQREGMMKKYGLKTLKDFEAFLDKHINQDPADLLPRATHRLPDTLHIVATQDTTVPTANQRKLIDFYPNPTIYETKANHFNAIVGMGLYHKRMILDFLLTRMEHLP